MGHVSGESQNRNIREMGPEFYSEDFHTGDHLRHLGMRVKQNHFLKINGD